VLTAVGAARRTGARDACARGRFPAPGAAALWNARTLR